ncbi:dodecin flavoprotein [Thermanaerothrix daxensis]|uniref:Dodecin flavoprotein n=1 Tax=Thermanaerothrix daxensis TaxID=869279 RepID=A0A0P6XHX8_9CHLR|nr:dodecin [Thermanaerothrix daxensis]KPL82821.1 dodecin flavoprotein [Thermanaerothrix daxensis]
MNKVYKIIEITGTSDVSVEDAIQTAIGRAAQTVRHLQWFEVSEIRGRIEGDHVGQWQVTIKIGFTLED